MPGGCPGGGGGGRRRGAGAAGRGRPAHSGGVAPSGPVFVSGGSGDGRESERRDHSAGEPAGRLAAMPLVDHARLPPGGSNHSPPHRRRSTSGPSRLRCLSGSTRPFRDTSARAEGLIGPSHPGGTAHALPSDRAGRTRLGAAPAGRRRPSHSRCVAPAGPVFVSSGSRDGRESEHRGHSAVEATDVAGAALPGRHSLTRSGGGNHSPPHRPWSAASASIFDPPEAARAAPRSLPDAPAHHRPGRRRKRCPVTGRVGPD